MIPTGGQWQKTHPGSSTQRRGNHRKKVSALRLSSDTTSTLPEYNLGGWERSPPPSLHPATALQSNTALPPLSLSTPVLKRQGTNTTSTSTTTAVELLSAEDLPPEYPDSAEEGDEDTDCSLNRSGDEEEEEQDERNTVYLPPLPSARFASRSTVSLTTPSLGRTKRSKYAGAAAAGVVGVGPGLGAGGYYQQHHHHHHHHHSSGGSTRELGYRSSTTGTRTRRRHHPSPPGSAPLFPPPSSTISNTQDDFLDSLLQRSVQALEMSNVLMQTSMSTHTSLSPVLRGGDRVSGDVEDLLERRARGLSRRLRRPPVWEDDLDEIRRALDGLGGSTSASGHEEEDGYERTRNGDADWRGSGRIQSQRRVERRPPPSAYTGHGLEASLSSSLPPTSSMPQRPIQTQRRRPSLDLRKEASIGEEGDGSIPHLRLEPKERQQLVSPPPRALTQYISNDPDEIVLPSTLGLRAGSHSWKTAEGSSSTLPVSTIFSSLTAATATAIPPPRATTPTPTDSPASAAYNMLTSLVTSPPSTSSSPVTSPRLLQRASSLTRPFRRRTSTGSQSPSVERGTGAYSHTNGSSSSQHPPSSSSSASTSTYSSLSRSRSITPKNLTISTNLPGPSSGGSTIRTTLTPPLEDPSSSSDGGGCPAKLTVQSLRKILDDQVAHTPTPPPVPPASKFKPPSFIRSTTTAAPISEPSTSTATASVSRLFTKGTHSSSMRPAPKQSSLKQPTPLPSPTMSATPDTNRHLRPSGGVLSLSLSRSTRSNPSSSGVSTPSSSKRISFAELPESTRTEGGSSLFRKRKDAAAGKKKRRKAGSSKHGRKRSLSDGEEGEGDADDVGGFGWWAGWLFGGVPAPSSGSGSGAGIGGTMGERAGDERRGWGAGAGAFAKPGFGGGGMEEWTI